MLYFPYLKCYNNVLLKSLISLLSISSKNSFIRKKQVKYTLKLKTKKKKKREGKKAASSQVHLLKDSL